MNAKEIADASEQLVSDFDSLVRNKGIEIAKEERKGGDE